MKAFIKFQDEATLQISWVDPEKGFGVLTMVHESHGNYLLDSEFMSINTVIEIFKALEL